MSSMSFPTDAIGAPLARRRADVQRVSRGVYWRRRLAVLAGLVALTLLFALSTGWGGAEAGLEDPVAGQAVVQPGDTLWDVAVEHAPAGVDPRQYLENVRDLNGFSSSNLPAWTVVLLPRR